MAYRPWEEEKYSWDADPMRSTYGGYQSPDSAEAVTATLAKPAATEAPTKPNPWIQGAGLGLQGVGTILGAYGAYKQGEQAERDFKRQEEAYDFDKALSLQDRAKEDEERKRRALLESGNYAGDYLQRAMQNYGRYNAMGH